MLFSLLPMHYNFKPGAGPEREIITLTWSLSTLARHLHVLPSPEVFLSPPSASLGVSKGRKKLDLEPN